MADVLSPLTYGAIDFRLFRPQRKQKKKKRKQPTKQSKNKSKFKIPSAKNNAIYGNELEATFPWTERLAQANLDGISISVSDSEHFGHNFPLILSTNTTIVTFQNIGQQPNEATKSKSTHTNRAFRSSNVSMALFAKYGLNEAKLQSPHLFNTRMKSVEPHSFSYITNNINEKAIASWNQT